MNEFGDPWWELEFVDDGVQAKSARLSGGLPK
jgi:hypothetical protein